jgi:hypothetical protein
VVVVSSFRGRRALRSLTVATGAFAICAMGTVACSLLTDLDELDGEPVPPDGGGSETNNNNTIVDGQAEATAQGDDAEAGAPKRFCATLAATPAPPLLCEDFEDPTISGWSTPHIFTTSAKVGVQVEDGGGGNRVLFSEPAGAQDSVRYAFLERGYLQPTSHSRLSYRMFVEQPPGNGAFEVNLIRYRAVNGTNGDFYVLVDNGGISLFEQAFQSDGGGGGRLMVQRIPVSMREWHRFSIEVDFATAKLKFTLDGTAVTVDQMLVKFVGPPSISVGITYVGKGSANGRALFDDLVFEVLP